MKNLLFIILICAAFAVEAQNGNAEKALKKGFIEIGVPTLFLKPTDGDLKSFLGLGISGGKYVTKNSYVGLGVNLNILLSNPEEIGTYTYSTCNCGTTYQGTVGKNYNVIPVLATWALSLDLSENVHFNAGPVVGTSFVHSYYDFRQKKPKSSSLPDMTELEKDRPKQTKNTFTYGAEVGLLFKAWEGFMGDNFIGLRYKYLRNTGPTFDGENLMGAMNQGMIVINCTW